VSPASALLPSQGFAVLRRDAGRVYVALDYGTSGGGHGHPDRLNLWLVRGDERVLEDVGTGSYVEKTLHWYRSTLAHNAPLVNGHSQDRVDGELLAWDEEGDAGWIDARVSMKSGVLLRRSVVAMQDYLVDRLDWDGPKGTTIDLPLHALARGDSNVPWHPASLEGGSDLEDGFDFTHDAEEGGGVPSLCLSTRETRAWILADSPHTWWRAMAPGPPGSGERPFHLVRVRRAAGAVTSVWTWGSRVRDVRKDGEILCVRFAAGAEERHTCRGEEWQVERVGDAPRKARVLSGIRVGSAHATSPAGATPARAAPTVAPHGRVIPLLREAPATVGALTALAFVGGPGAPLAVDLGEREYRRSEATWRQAGAPKANVSLGATADTLLIEVSVRKKEPVFAPARLDNPLDNEHPDINSDGIQLYVAGAPPHAARRGAYHAWLLVPEPPGGTVRVAERRREGNAVPLDASWRPTPAGYEVLIRIPREAITARGPATVLLDLIVNETSAERSRRRGQLVLSGGAGEWVYLRGDRQDSERFLVFEIPE
jgi:hypothetical protein